VPSSPRVGENSSNNCVNVEWRASPAGAGVAAAKWPMHELSSKATIISKKANNRRKSLQRL
jgi:hypothetical protein